MEKTCAKCEKSFDLSMFHKDRTAKDGYSASCKTCRNASKRRHGFKTRELAVEEIRHVSVPIESENNIFKMLSDKFGGSFYTICVEGSGACRVQVFKDQPKIIRGENFNVEDLMLRLAR